MKIILINNRVFCDVTRQFVANACVNKYTVFLILKKKKFLKKLKKKLL